MDIVVASCSDITCSDLVQCSKDVSFEDYSSEDYSSEESREDPYVDVGSGKQPHGKRPRSGRVIGQILVHSSALNAEKNRCTNLMCAKIATKERKETSSFHVQTANSGRQERNLSFVKAVRVTPRDRPLNQLPLKLLGQHGQVGIQFEEKFLQRVQNLYIKMTLF